MKNEKGKMKVAGGQWPVAGRVCKMICISLIFNFQFSIFNSLYAQSGLYVPSAKPIKNMQKALTNPPTFCLLLSYDGIDSAYSVDDLDLLDSAYRIAFDIDNPNY